MRAVDALPDWCGEEERSDAEAHLIGLAGEHTLEDLKRLANRVIEVIDPDGAEEILGAQLQAQERRAWDATRLAMRRRDSGPRVIDHGTTKRLFGRHQRLALAVRDQGCVWAGCDRPPAWCDAHHLDFWSEDGPTDLDNAALFCHFHHFLLHEGEWIARMGRDGIVEVIPPARVDRDRVPRRRGRFARQQPRAA